MGDRLHYLKSAINTLAGSNLFENIKVSSVYETGPQDMDSDNDFLNLALSCTTEIPPADILDLIKSIEREFGRDQSQVYHDRTLDIDILAYGDKVIRTYNLAIPHLKMHERPFVLVPLSEIEPDFIHPVIKLKPEQMLGKINKKYKIKKVEGIRLDGQI